MAMTKRQLAAIDKLQNGGWIWMAGATPFIAEHIGDKVASKPLHRRTFEGLLEADILAKDGNKYTLKQ